MNILINQCSRLLCEVLTESLQKEPGGFNVVASHDKNTMSGFVPDIIVVDYATINKDIFSRWPDVLVLLIDTGMKTEDIVNHLMYYKIKGVLSIDSDMELFKKALKTIHHGEIWLDNTILSTLLNKAGNNIPGNKTIEHLSKREKEVLDFIAKGYKNKEIAAQLFLSEQTIKAHASRILKKFSVSSRSKLINVVMRTDSAGTFPSD